MPPKNITTTGSLGFGRFVAGGGGSITVNHNGARTRTGSVVLLASSATAAAYAITANGQGNDNRIYILTLPPNGSVSLASGANRMAVNNFTSSAGPGAPLPSAPQRVTVGATLQVAPGQAPGAYAGSFNVTLEYQ